MKKQHEETTSRHFRNHKPIKFFIVAFLIFCFAERAAGSCLNYGHSCWGAHGKRSYDGPRISQHRKIDTLVEDERRPGNGELADNPNVWNNQNGWFLARLINLKLKAPPINSMDNTRLGNRWHKRHSLLPLSGGWYNDYSTTSDEIFGDDKIGIEKNSEDSTDSDYSVDMTRKMAKPRDGIRKALGVPTREEYLHHYPSHTSKLRLYKMTDSSDDDNTL